jgi:hypothetical protein
MVMSKKQRHSWFVHTYACADVCRQLLGPDCISDESSDPLLLFLCSTEYIEYCCISLKDTTSTSTSGTVICTFTARPQLKYRYGFRTLQILVKFLRQLYLSLEHTTEPSPSMKYPKVDDFTNLQHVLMYQISSVNPWAS